MKAANDLLSILKKETDRILVHRRPKGPTVSPPNTRLAVSPDNATAKSEPAPAAASSRRRRSTTLNVAPV